MSRSFINLRRALFGTSCAIVFGFGTSQALASPQGTARREWQCSLEEPYEDCTFYCRIMGLPGRGTCNLETGQCTCAWPE